MKLCVSLLLLCLLWTPSVSASSKSAPETSAPEILFAAPGDEIRLVADAEETAEFEAAFGGGVLRPVPGTVTAPEAGDHWLAVASRDEAGNLSPVRWILVKVDDKPPAVDVKTLPEPIRDDAGRSWLPPGSEVLVTVEDQLAGVSGISLDVGDEHRESSENRLTMPLPNDGEVRVAGSARDRVDNRSQASVLDLAIDGTPPKVGIRITGSHLPGEGGGLDGAVLAPTTRLEANLDDDGSGIAQWRPEVNGEGVGENGWAGPWSSGPQTVGGEAADRVGNSTRIGPTRFVVDGEGPEISWRVVGDGFTDDRGESWYGKQVAVEVSAEDRPAGVETISASIDGTSFEPLTGPIMVDGDHVQLRATDRLGNSTEIEARWNVDRAPPRITVASPGGVPVPSGITVRAKSGDDLEVNVLDAGAGVESAEYSYYLGGPRPGLKPVEGPIRCWRSGRFLLYVRATDRLGNEVQGEWPIIVQGREKNEGDAR